MELELKRYATAEVVNLCKCLDKDELIESLAVVLKVNSSYVPKTMRYVSINGDNSGLRGTYTVETSGGSSPVNDKVEQAECRVELPTVIQKHATHKYGNTYGWINKADEFIECQLAFKVWKRNGKKADMSKLVEIK